MFASRFPFYRFDTDGKSKLIEKAEGREAVMLRDFLVTHLLGRGGFGKVYLGELAGENEQFAIKSIRKDKLAAKPDVISNVFLECNVLV